LSSVLRNVLDIVHIDCETLKKKNPPASLAVLYAEGFGIEVKSTNIQKKLFLFVVALTFPAVPVISTPYELPVLYIELPYYVQKGYNGNKETDKKGKFFYEGYSRT
jgi:hypothetical protein